MKWSAAKPVQGSSRSCGPNCNAMTSADGGSVVVGELGEHQPVLGRPLHPGADVGDEGAGDPDPIVEASQGPEDARKWSRSSTLRRIAAVEAAELPRRNRARSAERPTPSATTSLGVPQFEIADAADEDIADDDIEKSPEHVDGRRGEPLPRRLGERALERLAHHAADEMRDRRWRERRRRRNRTRAKATACQALLVGSRSMISWRRAGFAEPRKDVA